jgi:hypothetical protein
MWKRVNNQGLQVLGKRSLKASLREHSTITSHTSQACRDSWAKRADEIDHEQRQRF